VTRPDLRLQEILVNREPIILPPVYQ